MKRVFDFVCSLVLLFLFALPMLVVAGCIKLTSVGPVWHWSNRVGKDNVIFKMPKFRTMLIDTPVVATHLLGEPGTYVTRIGRILRQTSLDELPQLISIIKGDMSFVGPRPALYNQDDLIELRTQRGIHRLPPGLTGWAQINGRDELPIPLKVDLDHYYLLNHCFLLDLKIIFLTAVKVVLREGVVH